MQAIVVTAPGQVAVQRVPVPELAENQILVKTSAIALNPTDWKHDSIADSSTLHLRTTACIALLHQHRDFVSPPNARLGCDFAGTVDKVAEGVTHVQVGDRVAGFVHGGRWEDIGSFAEYVKTDSTLVWKVPESVSWEEAAASGGIAPLTAVQALYLRLKLNQPSNPVKDDTPVLVWGAASSVGLYAVQLLRLSGYRAIAVASPKNWDLVKSLGADSTYDYSDPDVLTKIASDFPTLSLALDCISENGTTFQCAQAFASRRGHVVALLPLDDARLAAETPEVKTETTLVYTVLGKAFHWWFDWPVMDDDKRTIEQWLKVDMPYLMGSGQLKSNPLLRREGGLEQVNSGMDFQKAGKNSAQKLVYTLA
ncbi:hypothetical protein JCM11491_005466 [Sporobolomyces phaffii]